MPMFVAYVVACVGAGVGRGVGSTEGKREGIGVGECSAQRPDPAATGIGGMDSAVRGCMPDIEGTERDGVAQSSSPC